MHRVRLLSHALVNENETCLKLSPPNEVIECIQLTYEYMTWQYVYCHYVNVFHLLCTKA